MTKPISHHLTTGTFNYVVKDPDCSRLSGQFWIKDQLRAKPQVCVLELDCAVLYWGDTGSVSLFTGLAAVFCANFLILLKSVSCVNLFFFALFKFQKIQVEDASLTTATAQNVKTSKRLEIEARSSKLLIP